MSTNTICLVEKLKKSNFKLLTLSGGGGGTGTLTRSASTPANCWPILIHDILCSRLNFYTRWCLKLDDMVGVYTPNSVFYKKANKEKIRKRVSNAAYAQGVARHTDQEIGEMMSHDLEMLSKILGKIYVPRHEISNNVDFLQV